jgi:hypothetical protein
VHTSAFRTDDPGAFRPHERCAVAVPRGQGLRSVSVELWCDAFVPTRRLEKLAKRRGEAEKDLAKLRAKITKVRRTRTLSPLTPLRFMLLVGLFF